MRVKNTSPGPRGIFADGEIVMLAPGQSADLNVAQGDLVAAKAAGWFEFGGKADEDEKPGSDDAELDAMSDNELRAYLKARNVTVDGRLGREKLLEAAKAAPAEPTA